MFDLLGYAVSAASHGIDLSEATQALSTQELADYAAAHREAATRLGAMKLILAAEWVDQHPGEVCGGLLTERSLPIGGDGTPPVAEGAIDEWSDLVGVSNESAKLFLGDVLDLRHRLPLSWQKICLGGVEDWQARKIAQACRPLTREACRHVDRQIEPWIGQLGWTRMERLATAAVIDADPELAQQLADEARTAMGVWNSQTDEHNLKAIFIRADPLTVNWFMATTNLISDGLKADGDTRTADQRRAAAVNLLARPVDAAAFLARHATTPSDRDQPAAADTTPADHTEQAEQTGKAGKADHTGPAEQTGHTGPAEPAGHTGKAGPAEQTGQTEQAGQTADAAQPGRVTENPAGGGTPSPKQDDVPQPSAEDDAQPNISTPAAGPGPEAGAPAGRGIPAAAEPFAGPDTETRAATTPDAAEPDNPPHPGGKPLHSAPANSEPSEANPPTAAADTEADGPCDVAPATDTDAEPAWWNTEPDPDIDDACGAEWTPGWNAAPPWDGSTVDIPLPDEPDDSHCRCGHDTDAADPHLLLNVNLPAAFDKKAAQAAKPRIVLHYHLSNEGLASRGTEALVRPEHADPMRLTELLDMLKQTGCVVKVQPVIDPASTSPADAYEIPQKLRDAVRYRDCADVSPWSTSLSRSLDLDHTQPWRPDGSPGQTSYQNLGPLSRAPHRVKTLGLKHVRQPDPGTFLWRGRHGHLSIVTNRGTINLGRSQFTAALWKLADRQLAPDLPGRSDISTAEQVIVKLLREHLHMTESGPD